ncbi:putative oxidoreductase [Lysobacter niabensis]|uniref:Oxidoreductase n=1 Tax=Agrilutibacter niabensis TaxID=380628 RepID=A0ABU1VTU6_9GAMM|nr:DoxX family protein [Lysobacter niabensis]MDR7100643.1 putative oxidoreductase [Lysobacter niabensis]
MDALIERNRDALILFARILLMILFVTSGWNKLMDFQGTVGYLASIHTPMPQVAAAVAVLMECLVGIALILGLWTRPLAMLMALFVLGTGLIGHPFWSMEGADRAMNMTHFYKNLAIIGGLLLLAVTGPGRFALVRHRT